MLHIAEEWWVIVCRDDSLRNLVLPKPPPNKDYVMCGGWNDDPRGEITHPSWWDYPDMQTEKCTACYLAYFGKKAEEYYDE